MSALNNLVSKLNECIELIDEVRESYDVKYDSSGYKLWGINNLSFILIKSQLKHLVEMLKGHELDI